MMIVRRATTEDVPELCRLSRAIHAESRYAYLPFDEEKVARLVQDCCGDAGRRAAFIAAEGGQAIGAVGAYVTESFFCRALVGGEFYVYVEPAHRGGRAAMRLIAMLVAWARSFGAAELTCGVTAGINNEQAAKLYRHLGFEQSGELFTMRL